MHRSSAVAPRKTREDAAFVGETLNVIDVRTLWVPRDCREGFAGAYWRRPERYLEPGVQASISLLALLDRNELQVGTERLRADLASGAWHETYEPTLPEHRADFGYRLVLAER